MDENPPKAAPSTAHSERGLFQNEIYGAGLLQDKLPVVTLNPNLLEEQARQKVSLEAYNYVAGGAGEKSTMDANRLAFRQWKLVPRIMRGPTHRDLQVELFGQTYGLYILAFSWRDIFRKMVSEKHRYTHLNGTHWGPIALPQR